MFYLNLVGINTEETKQPKFKVKTVQIYFTIVECIQLRVIKILKSRLKESLTKPAFRFSRRKVVTRQSPSRHLPGTPSSL